VVGAGLGFVDVFDADGNLLQQLVNGAGVPQNLVVKIPSTDGTDVGSPTRRRSAC